jgi:protoheme ferro-lyase
LKSHQYYFSSIGYPSYKPHITISYKEIENIKDIKQPDFDIILGDEYTNPLNENWKEELEEKMEKENE